MPNIVVKIPAGAFDAAARASLAAGIKSAAVAAEQMPDDPGKQLLCWIAVEEVAAGCWTCGGADMGAVLIPVQVQVQLPHGVLDDDSRARYVAGVHRAILAALPDERRRIASSCILHEVPDGQWGVNGAIWRLATFAEHAGYAHLQG